MAYSKMTNRAAGYTVTEGDWDDITDNFDALDAFFELQLPLASSIPPMSGVQAAALDLVESSGAGTAKPVMYRLLFDKTTDEGRMWIFRIPRNYGSTPVLTGSYHTTGANTSKKINVNCQVACISDGDASRTAKVFAATNALDVNVPDAAGTEDIFSLTIANADSMAAGDWCCLLLWNDASGGTIGQDWALTSLSLTYSLA